MRCVVLDNPPSLLHLAAGVCVAGDWRRSRQLELAYRRRYSWCSYRGKKQCNPGDDIDKAQPRFEGAVLI